MEQGCQSVETLGGLERFVAKTLAVGVEPLAHQGLGWSVLTDVDQQSRLLGGAAGELRAVIAEGGRCQFDGTVVERRGLRVVAEALVDRSHDVVEARLHRRLIDQFGLQPFGATIEHLARGDLSTARLSGVGDLEQVHQEVGDRLCPIRFGLRSVALPSDLYGEQDGEQQRR